MKKEYITKASLTDEQIALFYLGQEGFIIKEKNTYIMIDGYLTDYVDKNCSDGSVKWIRKYAPPISPSELDFVDYVIVTHGHFDHTDPWTTEELFKVNRKAKMICPSAMADTVRSYGVECERIIPARSDAEICIGDIRITPVPAAHEQLNPDGNGSYKELGYRIEFANGISVYHSGDCCIYEGLEERTAGTDIMLLPVNGRSWYKLNVMDIVGNMTAEEAVLLAKNSGADMIVPLHFDLYDVNGISPASFVDVLKSTAPFMHFHIFAPGEKYIFGKETGK